MRGPPGAARGPRGGDNIFEAANRDSVGAVRHLLRMRPGAVAEKSFFGGATALHFAALGGRLEICRVLLAAGAEVDARSNDGLSATRWRRCCMLVSRFSRCEEEFKLQM